ncbi:hypothetical protein [Maridesulfovibrio sp.]|uniref:hypothetical protein n=1 Tax=Maridesulfovibrio sp. TaxID=2795000 RepID=UPI0039F1105A
MQVTGVNRQEKKIEAMADILVQLHHGTNKLSLKGALRMGIKGALAKQGFNNWKEIADKPIATKRQFFNCLLDESMNHLLKMGFPKELEKDARVVLTKQNDKFLRS